MSADSGHGDISEPNFLKENWSLTGNRLIEPTVTKLTAKPYKKPSRAHNNYL